MPRGKRASTRQQRIDWLLSHTELWDAFPNDVTLHPAKMVDVERQRFAQLTQTMVDAGLYSRSTYRLDVWGSIKDGIEDARRQRRIEKQTKTGRK